DDYPAVLGQRLADRVERLRHRLVDEAAGIDDDQVGLGIVADDVVALGAKLGQDAFRIDRGLGATERDETDARRPGGRRTRPDRGCGVHGYCLETGPNRHPTKSGDSPAWPAPSG